MFTTEFRDHIRQRVLELARADSRVTGGALIGSAALAASDEWSDVDVAFGIAEGNKLEAVLDDWTQTLDQEFSVVNHFDLHAGKTIFRVFLLPGGLAPGIQQGTMNGMSCLAPSASHLAIKRLPRILEGVAKRLSLLKNSTDEFFCNVR